MLMGLCKVTKPQCPKIVTAGNESNTPLQRYRDTQALEYIWINQCMDDDFSFMEISGGRNAPKKLQALPIDSPGADLERLIITHSLRNIRP
jgi:hypothetical protein